MNEIKKLSLECILFCMNEIKDNLKTTSDPQFVKAQCQAMVCLAEAYSKVQRSYKIIK